MTNRTNISRKTARKMHQQMADRIALIADVKDTIAHSAKDNSDFYVTDYGNFRVTTQYSDQPHLSRNGGHYTYYRMWYFQQNGAVRAISDWSADFDYQQWNHDENEHTYHVGDWTADDLLRAVDPNAL